MGGGKEKSSRGQFETMRRERDEARLVARHLYDIISQRDGADLPEPNTSAKVTGKDKTIIPCLKADRVRMTIHIPPYLAKACRLAKVELGKEISEIVEEALIKAGLGKE